ncbi:hypothetical protein BDF14DRAFT_1788209 [Spinellus fusiger]|nr:hypothetical protein BDF14DRAFT_1788209 [Spinellus fusiger]
MLFFVFMLCYYTNWLDLNAAIVGSTFGTIGMSLYEILINYLSHYLSMHESYKILSTTRLFFCIFTTSTIPNYLNMSVAWIDTAHGYITVYYMCFIAVYTRL